MTADLPAWRRWLLAHLPAPLLREPFVLWLAAVCILSGAAQLASLTTAPLAAQLMPKPFLIAWNAELVVGGVLTIWGVVRNRSRVLVLGLQPLAVAAVAYALGLFVVAGSRAVLSAGITLAFAGAAFIKAFVYSTSAIQIEAQGGQP